MPIIGNCNYTENVQGEANPGEGGWTLTPDATATVTGPGSCPDLFSGSDPEAVTLLGTTTPITVSLGGSPEPARVEATSSSVAVTDAEQNDVVQVRNVDGDTTASSIEVDVIADDEREPEFELRSPTCTETLRAGESCTYTVVVNSRPEADGRVVIDYRDGTGDFGRTVSIDVDIES